MSNQGEQLAGILRDLQGKHICEECSDTFATILAAIRQLPKQPEDPGDMAR